MELLTQVDMIIKWVVVKIMVPFWVLIKIRNLLVFGEVDKSEQYEASKPKFQKTGKVGKQWEKLGKHGTSRKILQKIGT